MKESTKALLKKFEQENEVYVSATEKLTYWLVYARVPKSNAEGVHRLHHGIKYVSGPAQDGNVLVLRDPFISDAYSAETWGPLESIDDFVEKALVRIREEMTAGESGSAESCGTGCS